VNETLHQWLTSLQAFWLLVVDVWREGAWGIDIGRILSALVVFLVFVALRRVLTRFILKRLYRWAKKTSFQFDDIAVQALDAPVRFVPVIMGAFFAFEMLDFSGNIADIGYRVIRSLVAFVIFWALYNLIVPFSSMLGRLEQVFTSVMVEWLIKAVRLAVVIVGAATILQVWGIAIGPVLAGLGLIGVAVALGAQDLFKNLIAGILIIVEKRFSHGDWILVDGVVEGTIENFGFRSTLVRRFDKAPVFVPNAKLSDNAVTNFSMMTYRRIYWRIGVLYSTSIEQLREIRDRIERYVVAGDDFADPSEVATFVRIDSFNDSSIDIMLYCFTRTTQWGEWLEIKERLAYHVKEVVESAGSGFAFPSRSLYIESPTGEKAEVFVPPGASAGEAQSNAGGRRPQ
jgi:MscS family membrane protein